MHLTRFLASAALAGAFACDGGVSIDDGVDPIAPGAVGHEEELGGAAAGFQSAGGAYRAESEGHRAEVSAAGAIRMTPVVAGTAGSAIELETAAIERGEESLGAAAGRIAVAANGALAIERGEATELLDNRQDGVEQSWRFASEPAGAGDLVVEVGVSGHANVDSGDAGLVFRPARGAGVRYSHAIWIDADQTAWDLPVVWDGDRVAIRVPESILVASRYPAVLDPTISGETAVESLTLNGYTGAKSREPAIAWSGTRFLIAWRDDRMGADSDIYVARVDSDGVVIDPRGILVSSTAFPHSEPTVTWTGSAWLVAWTRNARDIAAATVSPAGALTQLGDVAATAAIETQPAVASDGNGAYLLWQADGNVRGARFSGGAFGAATDIAATGDLEAAPAIAGNPAGGYLALWETGADRSEDVRGQLIDGAGALSGAPFDVAADTAGQTAPAAAFDGTGFIVAYAWRNDIWATAVDTAGVAGTPIELSGTPTVEGSPALACDPASCLVTWQDRRDTVELTAGVYGRRVGFDLSLEGGVITISDPVRNQLAPAVASADTGFIAVWQDVRSGLSTVTMSPIDTNGSLAEPDGVIVNRSARNVQTGPGIARSASGQLVVWSDSRNAGDDVMARRYDAAGTRLDASALSMSGAPFDQTTPAIDFDGQSYLAVWADNRNSSRYDIYAARMAPDGTLLDPAGFPVSTAAQTQLFPDVASGGGVSLAIWQDRSNKVDYDLMGAVITQAGTVEVSEIEICREVGDQRRSAVAWDPASSTFVVVWADGRAAGDENVYAARVATDGTVLDPCGVAVSTAAGAQSSPAIAASGGQLLVTWDDRRSDLSGDVYGTRITAAGAIAVVEANGVALASGAGMQVAPTQVGIKDGRFSLAWVDDRNRLTTATDLYGNTVNADGTLAGAEYLISANTDAESAPSFESNLNAARKAYLVYERTNQTTGVTRVRRRWITH